MLAPLARTMHSTSRALLDLLFPPRCVSCKRAGEWFCADCQTSIEPIAAPLCERCGRPLASTTCSICAHHLPETDQVRAVAFFENHLRQAIHAFKYEQRVELAAPFGVLLRDRFVTLPWRADVLIGVPLHAEREKARGYNQAHLLATALGDMIRLPVWKHALTRIRHTRPQVELTAAERRVNVQDAFQADPSVAGKRIVLIDDVCTTGVTMDACSTALKKQGAQSVWGLALARPRLD
jgi:ComF family protein